MENYISISATEYARLVCAWQDMTRLAKLLEDKQWTGLESEETRLLVSLLCTKDGSEGSGE